MRYTNGFKMNVGQNTLDMPFRDSYDLVMGKAKFGEQYNYVIDRFIILFSVAAFAWGKVRNAHRFLAVIFFVTKFLAWAQSVYNNISALKYDEEIEKRQAIKNRMPAPKKSSLRQHFKK